MDKREKMFALVEQCRSGDLSMKGFSERHNIKLPTFTYWVQKKRRAEEVQSTGQFIPINAPIDLNDSGKFELVYPNGVRLRLSEFNIDQVRQLITIYGC